MQQAGGGATTAGSDDPLVGQVLDGRYEVEAKLGEGGMGIVYKAKHTTLGKPLAVKVLRPEVSKNEEILARFRQEAQSASAIGNQHIIDISDFGVLPDGSTYFVMEFLTGQSLTDALQAEKLTTERTVRIARQLCSALGAAHEIGVVHRDLKPDNVQLIKRGGNTDFVKVLDFGIAKVGGSTSKLTQAGQVFGTPHYMSPEQCAGTGVDHRTDIYALGVILYEMGTGKVPFDADNLMGILTKHLYENPIPPHELPPPTDVPSAFEAIILKALAKKPEARYQTMAELAADLEAMESGATPRAVVDVVDRASATGSTVGGAPRPSSVTVGLGQPEVAIKRSKGPLIAVVSLAVLALGGAAAMVVGGGEDEVAGDAHVVAPAAPEPEPAPAAAAPEPEAEPVKEVPPPVAAPAPRQKVSLISKPEGAEVYKDGALRGTTPFELLKPEKGSQIKLELQLSGYKSKSVLVTELTAKKLRVSLSKERKASKPRRKAPPPKAEPPKRKEPQRRRMATEVLDPWD